MMDAYEHPPPAFPIVTDTVPLLTCAPHPRLTLDHLDLGRQGYSG